MRCETIYPPAVSFTTTSIL